jgi:hypothetical protein
MHRNFVTFCLHYLPILEPNYIYVIISINPIISFPLPFYFTTNLGDLQDTVSLNNNIIYYRKSTESWTMGNGPFFYGHYQLP